VTSADPAKRLSFAELGRELFRTGGTLTGRSNVSPRGVGSAFSVQIADVEVDPETGKVQVARYTVVQDAGKAIHPSYVEGQMQGGAVQGIGWALWEGYEFGEAGAMLNPSLLDYKLPTSLDVPMIDTVIVEVANPGHPFGVRGVGEVPIVPPPAAVASAVSRAIGTRMSRLPITPYRVLEATGVLEAAR
jgi:CO/xanthine dehydrogenase Mo-binding subunit